ncbi:MAG TPA: hypothetical protein VM049_01270 [Gaiellaceae bacterium]|nr:hypothetical protein [Gaiellaceae bacterium]
MAPITVSTTQLGALAGLLRGFVRFVRRLAVAALVGVALLAAALARGGFSAADAILTALLLGPPAVLLFFAQGVSELISLPERLRRMPGEGGQRLAELTRLAGEARAARLTGMPSMLWRLRGTLGSFRDLAGVALPLRVLAPPFLGLTAIAVLLCILLAGVGVIALVALAAG